MRQQPAVPNFENIVAQNLYKPRERTSPPDLHKITITLGQSTNMVTWMEHKSIPPWLLNIPIQEMKKKYQDKQLQM